VAYQSITATHLFANLSDYHGSPPIEIEQSRSRSGDVSACIRAIF